MSYFRMGDPEADFARIEHEQEAWLKSRPKCDCCHQHIQDERFMRIDGSNYCLICADVLFGEYTEEFIG